MKYIRVLGTSLLWIGAIIIISTFFITLLSYFNVIGEGFTSILKIIIPVVSLFIGGIKIGKYSKKKGWLEGLKLSIVFMLIVLLLNLLLLGKLEFKNILYYIILITSSIFGSIIGINKNNQENS